MKNLVHRLSDPRDPAYPFSNTYICSNCNERLTINDTECKICDLYIHGMIKKPAEVGDTNKKTVKPDYDKSIEKSLKRFFDKYHTMKLENYIINDNEMEEQIGSAVRVNNCKHERKN